MSKAEPKNREEVRVNRPEQPGVWSLARPGAEASKDDQGDTLPL